MTSRTRLWVLAISTPVIAFAVIGGYLGQAMARENAYRHLRVFEDVVSLVVNTYVEEVDMRQAMRGAMRGLADGLDPDSAHLPADLTSVVEANAPAAPAEVGIELSRKYYLWVVSVREGSPAAKAGIRTGDFIRGIDNRPTRDMSAFEGNRLLRGAPGSKVTLLVIRGNAADPHEMALVRERITPLDVTSKMANASTGLIRVHEFSKELPARLKQATDQLARSGASRFILDLRGTSRGEIDEAVAAARLFIKAGTLSVKQTKTQREPVAAQPGDGALTAPTVLLIDEGTAGPAEVFAAALDGNGRADLVGERTLGRAARQQLVKLPDGSGLLLTNLRYLTPANVDIHEKGLEPDVAVEQPEVDFGMEAPTTDATLERALQVVSEKTAA